MFVRRSSDNVLAVHGPFDVQYCILVALKDIEIFAISSGFPQEAGHVKRCRCETFAVGGVGKSVYGAGVAAQFHGGMRER